MGNGVAAAAQTQSELWQDLFIRIVEHSGHDIELKSSGDRSAAPPAFDVIAAAATLLARGAREGDLERAMRGIGRLIARIDQLLGQQVDAILHHPRFQQLEALWRSLSFLVDQADLGREILDNESPRGALLIRILNVSKRELTKDLANPTEFDQSKLFKKVYEQEFGMPGGQPYGILIGDYTFSHRLDDVDLLTGISGVAAAAFAPFVAAASPGLIALDDFGTLEQPIDVSQTAQQPEYLKWRAFREHPDARFVGLVMPRVLVRRPYQGADVPRTAFIYREEVESPSRDRYLWGNPAFAFASVVMRAYATSGWFADIRGAHRGVLDGGLVTGLPVHCFGTDPWGLAVKSATEVRIDDIREKELAKLGLIPLCDCKDTGLAVFYANPSVYQPKKLDDPLATASERMESMLQYTLCASRFAHYVKVLGRDQIGSVRSPWELEKFFNDWLTKYVTSDSKAAPPTKAKYPLRVGEAEVLEIPGRPGNYRIVLRLCPHYQLDDLHATVRLMAQVNLSGTT